MKIACLIPLALSLADLIQAEVFTTYSNEVLTSVEYITTRVPHVYTITDAAGSVITATDEDPDPTATPTVSSSLVLSNVTVALAFSSIAAGVTAGTASASNSIIPTGSVAWPNITTTPPSSVQLTVSTALSTVTYTVTHCDNNPGCHIGSVTTEVVEYTTTCPVGTNTQNSTVFMTVPHTVSSTENGTAVKTITPSTLLTYSKATKISESESKPSFSATGYISGAKTTQTGDLSSSARFSNTTSQASKSIPTPPTGSGYKIPPTGTIPLVTLIPVAASSDNSGAVPSYFPLRNSTSETAAGGTASASISTGVSGKPPSYSAPLASYGTSVTSRHILAPSSASSAESAAVYSTNLSGVAPSSSSSSTESAAGAYSTNLSGVAPSSSSSNTESAAGTYSTSLSAVVPGPSVTIPTSLPSKTATETAGSTRHSSAAACVTPAYSEGGIVAPSGLAFSAGASITMDGTVYSFAANATGVLGILSGAAPSANVTFVAPSAPSAPSVPTNWIRRFRA